METKVFEVPPAETVQICGEKVSLFTNMWTSILLYAKQLQQREILPQYVSPTRGAVDRLPPSLYHTISISEYRTFSGSVILPFFSGLMAAGIICIIAAIIKKRAFSSYGTSQR
jgi:hypothetical protein